MSKLINSKQKKIILDVIKNNYNNNLFNINDIDNIINDIIKKSNLTINNNFVQDYVQIYLHKSNSENMYYFDVNKRKIIKKNLIIVNNLDQKDKNYPVIEKTDQENLLGQTDLKILLEVNKESEPKSEHEIIPESQYAENILEQQSSESSASLNTEELDNLMNGREEIGYIFPKDKEYKVVYKSSPKYGPYGSQWIHDIQVHDIIDKDIERRAKMLNYFLKIEYYDQKSKEWIQQRESKITASDIGCVLGENNYEATYKFIIKKVSKLPFKGNMNMYHGNKYENVAAMIYEYRMNVRIKEFGLIEHLNIKFLGASPDGIISEFKYDGIHRTNLVGRMLEIKCPQRRQIITQGEIKDNICPLYYWDQVQLQLECCDLDECDFWQCNVHEYFSRNEFLKDTDPNEPFRSKKTGFEKGCLIQILPKNKMNETLNNYLDVVYENSKFIYPDRIEMTPLELDQWIMNKIEEIKYKDKYKNYCVDRVIYWRLQNSHCSTIKRDKKWFDDKLPTMRKIWNYVEFFRKNQSKYQIIYNYIESMKLKKNDNIMDKIEIIYNCPNENDKKKMNIYNDKLTEIIKETSNNIEKNKKKEDKNYEKSNSNFGSYMF